MFWHGTSDGMHMQKIVINTQKYPVCHTLPCIFGSTLTPRAYNHFINIKT